MAQVKILAYKDIVDKFKKIVLAKHGKLELSAEGGEAFRLYIKKHESLLGGLCAPEQEPLTKICGVRTSHQGHSVRRQMPL